MINIAIAKEGKIEFFMGADGKPRPYPTMADALVSAQYLGLGKGDVELHFVKEGTVPGQLSETVDSGAPPKKGGGSGKSGIGGAGTSGTGAGGAGTGPQGSAGGSSGGDG